MTKKREHIKNAFKSSLMLIDSSQRQPEPLMLFRPSYFLSPMVLSRCSKVTVYMTSLPFRRGQSSIQQTFRLRGNTNGLTWTIPGRAATLPICFMAGRKPPTPEDKTSVLETRTHLILSKCIPTVPDRWHGGEVIRTTETKHKRMVEMEVWRELP